MWLFGSGRLAHTNERWSQDAVVETVAALELASHNHVVAGVVVAHHGLVLVRIEVFAERIVSGQAVRLKHAPYLALDEGDSLHPGHASELGGQTLQSAVQIVDDRE